MEEFTVPGKLDELELPPGATRLDVAALGVDEAEALVDSALHLPLPPTHRSHSLRRHTRRVWGTVRQRRHVCDGAGRGVGALLPGQVRHRL